MTSVESVLLVVKGLDLGGVERVVVDLAVGLRAAGVRAEVAVVNGARRQFVPPLEAAGIPVHLLSGNDHVGVAGVRDLRRLLRQRRFDVVHAHGPLPSVVVRMLAGRQPVVSTLHTLWPAHRGISRAGWLLTARRDAAVLAVSEAVAASLPRRVRHRAEVVPHGVDEAAVAVARRASPTPDPSVPSPSVPSMVVVASHRAAKNYPNLLGALQVAARQGMHFRVMAIGEGPDLVEHRRLAAELGLLDVIDFVEPRLDVLTLIAAADLLVVASDHEGQPLVVSEALALGVPVVATAVGRVPELVGDAVGRVVPTGNPDALGTAVLELLRNPELRARMGAEASTLPHRTLGEVVAEHLAIYRRVAAR